MIKSTYTKSKQTYKVSFELPADQVGEKRDVRVLGSFNNWSWDGGLAMKASKGKYTASTNLPAGQYQFRYLIDGNEWHNDDSASAYTDSGYGTTNCCFNLKQVETKKSVPKKSTKKAEPKKEAKTTEKAEAKKEANSEDKAKAKSTAKKSTTKKSTAKRSSADDLKKIEGIGPKIAGLLNDADIKTFEDLSKASEKKLADILQEAGARFRLAKPKTWQEQAKLAAAGKMDELKKLQDELKGGVRK